LEATENLNRHLPYDPVIPFLGICPKECNTGYCKGICTRLLIAALFTIVKLWKGPRFPTDEKIKKMWYLYTREFYSAMKKNEILSCTSKWMEMENSILSEVNQAQKTKNRMVCPEYVDFRSRANTAMWLDLDHMIRESTYRRYGNR
jgi:hypothetical protein